MCRSSRADQLIKDIPKLLAKKYRNYSRRCLIATKSLIVSYIRCGFTKKVCMSIYRFQDTGQDKQELNVLMWCLARIQKVDSVIRCQGPVVVLTGTVEPANGFS